MFLLLFLATFAYLIMLSAPVRLGDKFVLKKTFKAILTIHTILIFCC